MSRRIPLRPVVTLIPAIAVLAACTTSTSASQPSAPAAAPTALSVTDQEVAFCAQAVSGLSGEMVSALTAVRRGDVEQARQQLLQSFGDASGLAATLPSSAPTSVRDSLTALAMEPTRDPATRPDSADPLAEVETTGHLLAVFAYVKRLCWGG